MIRVHAPVLDTVNQPQRFENLQPAYLHENGLYYWRVRVTYSDSTQRTSSPSPFITAIGQGWLSTDLIWTGKAGTTDQSVSNLIRTEVPSLAHVAKAILSVTALDTETAKRNVFNVFVGRSPKNGSTNNSEQSDCGADRQGESSEIGIGPTRRAGSDLYYNSYDLTDSLSSTSGCGNVIGLYSYSQARQSGVLMQLTYFYSDGHSKVVYNSACDVSDSSAQSDGYDSQCGGEYAKQRMLTNGSGKSFQAHTQIYKTDSVIYGTSNESIGTQYYTELAQNVDTTRFPYDWLSVSDYESTPSVWAAPQRVLSIGDDPEHAEQTDSAKCVGRVSSRCDLVPSIVDNSTRQIDQGNKQTVRNQKTVSRTQKSYTISFDKEFIGDIQLTLAGPLTQRTNLHIVESEELQDGVAKSPMRTGNRYDETWVFGPNPDGSPAQNVSFTGFSLRAFRYVTIYYNPQQLSENAIDVQPVKTSAAVTSNTTRFSGETDEGSGTILASIFDMTKYSYQTTASDTIVDSVTRERRPYEGDLLVYQDLAQTISNDHLQTRNTWNWLLTNPSQYTEYRLLPAIGVYEDYLRTGDTQYVEQIYPKLLNTFDALQYNNKLHLVASSGSVDLIDWPRSEVSSYDFDRTKYKAIVNIVAYRAYEDLSKLAGVMCNASASFDSCYGQTSYARRASEIKNAIITQMYHRDGLFNDGLTSNGALVAHHSWQNDYYALAFGVYTDQRMADAIAVHVGAQGRQPAGSIYSAYFLYKGLVSTGHADVATQLLSNRGSSDERTYWSVVHRLGATISPEEWSTASKPNMTFSHVWGTGGGIGLVQSAVDAEPIDQLDSKYTAVNGQTDTTATCLAGKVSDQSFGNIPDGISPNYCLILQPNAFSQFNVTIPTEQGLISASNGSSSDTVNVTIPAGMIAAVHIPRMKADSRIALNSGSVHWNDLDGQAFMIPSGTWSIDVKNASSSQSGLQKDSIAARRGNWYYFKRSISNSSGEADRTIAYGKSNDSVLAGDWAGYGTDSLAVRRGNWYYFKNNIAGGRADRVIAYGKSHDAVLAGDWDGDGTDTLAVRRGYTYYFKDALAGGQADRIVAYGRSRDSVLVGDWDGDGKDTLAVRRGNWYYFKNSIAGGEADKVVAYGKSGDSVLVGDWNGDGRDTLAVRRGNATYFNNALRGGEADRVLVYGKVTDAMLSGNWW